MVVKRKTQKGKQETMKKPKTKSVLPWFGANSKGGPLIWKLLSGDKVAGIQPCNYTAIPFCGGLPELPYLNGQVLANDLHEDAWNFYSCSQQSPESLAKSIDEFICHPSALLEAIKQHANKSRSQFGSISRAAGYWAMCWLSRKGQGGTGKEGISQSVRHSGDGGGNASRLQAVKDDFPYWHDQFKRCEFLCEDFRVFMERPHDKLRNAIYCDAPWVEQGKAYLHSFDEQDHRDLRERLERFRKTRIVVRYADDPLLRELYLKEDGWTWIHVEGMTQAGAKDEVLIVRNIPSVILKGVTTK